MNDRVPLLKSHADLADWLDSSDTPIEDLRLVFAKPVYPDYWEDGDFSNYLGEDGELPSDLAAICDQWNAAINKRKAENEPTTWTPGDERAIVDPKMLEFEDRREP